MKPQVPLALASLVLAAIAGQAPAPAQTPETVVRIGIAAPLTGTIAHLGKDMENSARLAI